MAGVQTTPTVSADNHEFGVGDISIVSTSQNGDTYKIGVTIEFAMDFDREVEVEGTIHLSISVGSDDANVGWRPASYRRGSGTDTLVFGYTVKSNDLDTDGISVLGSWVGNDGAIYGVGGSGSIRVKDTDSRVTPEFTTGVTNHGGTRSTARSTWMARRFSRGRRPHLPGRRRHRGGRGVQPQDRRGRRPSPEHRVGPNDADGGLQTAAYRSSRSDSITFGYTVVPGDLDNDGITLLGSIGG